MEVHRQKFLTLRAYNRDFYHAKADGVKFNIPDNMVAAGKEELPMAMDIRGRLEDKEIHEIKLTLAGGTSGGMFVSKATLEELAFDNKLLIDLAVYASAANSENDTPESLIKEYEGDTDYDDAFRPDGSPKQAGVI